MVIIKNEQIQKIPVFEVFEEGKENEPLPLVIFYHGWESRKERVLEYGYTLARKGFRVVLPEAWKHGERLKMSNKVTNSLDFWEVVVQNIKELPLLFDYYKDNEKVEDNKISVAGLSMGGITVSAMLTQYDWIHAGVILMGSPSPVDFSKWLLKNYKIDGTPIYDLLDKEEINRKLAKLNEIALNEQPEKLQNRPVYFWHGVDDPIVPIHLTNNFIETIKHKPYSASVEYTYSEGVAHKVPREIIVNAADFLKRVNG